MLRLISANLNGIRSAASKGFFDWVAHCGPTVLGVQELKAQAEQLDGIFSACAGLEGVFHCAEKKGYSGVGLYSQVPPSERRIGLGIEEFDREGRWLEMRFDRPDRPLSILCAYFPSGSSSPERQEAKYRFLEGVFPYLARLKTEREFILVGDINIAHHPIDLKNWKSNQKNSGFLSEERAWMTRFLDEIGLVDVYRHLYPTAGEEGYTWWSHRGQAWAKNVGWRIDYQIATPGIAEKARTAFVYKETRFSDHAPLVIDYDLVL